MKKLITVAFLFIGITVLAQDRGSARAEMSQDEMATLRAKRLVMQLDLNAEQEEKLKKLFAKRIEANKELKEEIDKNKQADREEKAELRKERLEMNEEQKEELREILTEEQYLKWEQLQEKRRKGRRAPMRERKN